jgi:hypothetical protein
LFLSSLVNISAVSELRHLFTIEDTPRSAELL